MTTNFQNYDGTLGSGILVLLLPSLMLPDRYFFFCGSGKFFPGPTKRKNSNLFLFTVMNLNNIGLQSN